MNTLWQLAIIVTAPVWLPLILLITALDHYWLCERRLRVKLQKTGRYVRRADRILRPRDLTGTIIVDHAAWNHVRIRIWWTAEDVTQEALAAGIAPTQPREPEPGEGSFRWSPFDQWVSARFLNDSSGTAHLLTSSLRYPAMEHIRATYPRCAVVKTFSAGRELERRSRLAEAGAMKTIEPPTP